MSFSVSVCHGVVNMCIRVPVLLLFMVSLLSFCIPDEAKAAVSQPEYTEFSDLKGKTVSMITGAPFEELVLSKEPDVGQFTYFSSIPDIILALKRIRRDPGHLVRGG
jgi:polar amino acid transport system substrate-binding protein